MFKLLLILGLSCLISGIQGVKFFSRSRRRPIRQNAVMMDSKDYVDSFEDWEAAIPGMAGVDYPVYDVPPPTSFQCADMVPGYYADQEAECQLFHVCYFDNKQASFLCPNGTIFNQKYFVCDWWYNSDCSQASNFYFLNGNLFLGEQSVYEGTNVLTQDGFGTVLRPKPQQANPAPNINIQRRPSNGQRRPNQKRPSYTGTSMQQSSRTNKGNIGPALVSLIKSPLPQYQTTPRPAIATTYQTITGSVQASKFTDYNPDSFYDDFLNEYYDDSEYTDEDYTFPFQDYYNDVTNFGYGTKLGKKTSYQSLSWNTGYATPATPTLSPGKKNSKDTYYDEWLDDYYDDKYSDNKGLYDYFDDIFNEKLKKEIRYKRFLAMMNMIKHAENNKKHRNSAVRKPASKPKQNYRKRKITKPVQYRKPKPVQQQKYTPVVNNRKPRPVPTFQKLVSRDRRPQRKIQPMLTTKKPYTNNKKLLPLFKRIQTQFKDFNPRDFRFWAKLQKKIDAKRKLRQ